jgi:hypothetical protein
VNAEAWFLLAVGAMLALVLLVITIEQVRARRRQDRALSRMHGDLAALFREVRKQRVDHGSHST